MKHVLQVVLAVTVQILVVLIVKLHVLEVVVLRPVDLVVKLHALLLVLPLLLVVDHAQDLVFLLVLEHVLHPLV